MVGTPSRLGNPASVTGSIPPGKIWQNCMLAPPWMVGAPSCREFWIRQCPMTKIVVKRNVCNTNEVARTENAQKTKLKLDPVLKKIA